VSHPAELPDLFLDRSLGSIHVPNALRAAGLRLTTLAERYGSEHAQFVRDIEWLDEAGRRGEAVLMKDSRIYVNPLERAVVHQAGVRCFCLSKKNLKSEQMAQWFPKNLTRMASACSDPAPFIKTARGGNLRLQAGEEPRERIFFALFDTVTNHVIVIVLVNRRRFMLRTSP